MPVRAQFVAVGGGLLLGALLLLTVSWRNQQPSIKPADVKVQAVLRAPGRAERPLGGQGDHWTMEITLDKRTDRPLDVRDQYFFQVTPFTVGMSTIAWDFMRGWTNGDSGSAVGGTDISMGNDSRHVPMVVEALRSKGINVGAEAVDRIIAFGYVRERFPVQVRYYLGGQPAELLAQSAFVVYTHYERHWGRELSWTATFPVQVDQ